MPFVSWLVFPIIILFISFSCLIATVRASTTILNTVEAVHRNPQ